MTATWTARRASAGDASIIAKHRYFRDEPQQDLDAYAAWVVSRIERGTYIGFVAEAAGHVVGGAGAVLLDWGPTRGEASGTRARIVNVYTEEPWRKQGIARALVDKAMGACAEAGVRVFSLAASEDAAAMYRALGFVPYANEMILRRR
ncbi:GNAT family N-acetyltransferase [Rubrivivax gelatinosus]|uniref:GNAT family N-acetyltransferase n=1 Tax=Rubrivivax gelatinosus TaxID=28068 RepID=UPI00190549F5|nr:GNAT family N-acetyltransferase [Rubrivivax gelatinosus]